MVTALIPATLFASALGGMLLLAVIVIAVVRGGPTS
jgi:hypothetical protein